MNIFEFPFAGPIAVWCFFFISGYLVSNILYEKYSGRPGDFLTNRFLRIFPTYWAAILLGLVLIFVDAEGISKVNPHIRLPQNYSDWAANLFIFNLSGSPRIVPPAWSLAIELNWYLILFIASFFPKKWVLALLCVSLLLPFIIYFLLGERIYKPGAGFAFALGALAYHSQFRLPVLLQYLALLILPIVMFFLPLKYGFGWSNLDSVGVTFSLMGSVLLLFIGMPLLTTGKDLGRLSRYAGEVSYPLFLTHHHAGWFAANWFGVEYFPSWTLLFATTLVCLVISTIIVVFVEHPIARVRARIRNRY